MPPFDKHSIQPIPMDEEPDPLQMELVRKSLFSESKPIRSCLRKENDNLDKLTSTETKMKKFCHWHDSTSILWIESVDNMSLAEIDDCYYSTDDYTAFRDRERSIVRNFSNWRFMNKVRKDDYLGVESRLQRFHRRERTKNSLSAVLLEQELRAECFPNTEDDVAIARAYKRHTTESARLARERADINASLVGNAPSSSSSSSHQSKSLINEFVEMEVDGENTLSVAKESETPWEVPASTSNKKNNRTANLIRYATCTYPIPPVDDSAVIYINTQRVSQSQPQEHRYSYQNPFEPPKKMIAQAPAKQKVVQPQTQYHLNHSMARPQCRQQCPTNAYAFPNSLNQQWTWNQMPRNEVSATTTGHNSNQRPLRYQVF